MNEMARRRITLLTFSILLIATLFLFLKMILPFAIALFMGAAMAQLLRPTHDRLVGRRLRPRWAALLVTSGLVVVVIAPLAWFIDAAVTEGLSYLARPAVTSRLSPDGFLNQISQWPVLRLMQSPAEQAVKLVQSVTEILTTFVIGFGAALPEALLQGAFAVVACYFFLVDGRRFLVWAYDKIPLDIEVRLALKRSLSRMMVSVIWASFFAAAVQSVLMATAFASLGLAAPFFAGGLTFLLAWVPLVGSAPVSLWGAWLLYDAGLHVYAWLMLGAGVLVGASDNFVRVIVLKGEGNLHPLLSLLATFGGLNLFGFIGVFIGPVLMSVTIAILQIWPMIVARLWAAGGVATAAPPTASASLRARAPRHRGGP